jgi:endogenous inhibitor of DNA gyrase (YacG/DUF329 family)
LGAHCRHVAKVWKYCFPEAIGSLTGKTMPRKRTLKLRCPICKKAVKSGDAEFPFCSDRCRTIDLGKWASGAYVIPSPTTDEDEQIRESTPEDQDEEP